MKEENGEDYQDDMPSQLNSMYFKPSYPEASMLPPGQRMDTSDDMFGEVAYPETIEVFDSPGDRLEASGCNINDMQVKTLLPAQYIVFYSFFLHFEIILKCKNALCVYDCYNCEKHTCI